MSEFGIDYEIKSDNDNQYLLHGSFVFPENNEYNLRELLYKAVIMVITFADGYTVFRPFEEVVVFEDDVKIIDGVVTGHFNLNISKIVNEYGSGVYNIMFSLGSYLSNVSSLELR